MVQLTCYGGVGQIGGNQFLLEDGDTRLLLDFGQPFGIRGRFYEEYLKPRSSFGLLDPLFMGLVPPIRGLYRPDLEPPAIDLWNELEGSPAYRDLRETGIDGVILSHAHLDHTGYLSFIRWDIPVFTGALTAFIAKAVQDSGVAAFESEVVYAVPRETGEDGILHSSNPRKVPALQRPFRIFDCDRLTEASNRFWQDTPGARDLADAPICAAGNIGGLEVRSFPVDHSIPGARAFAFKTSAGWVAYTGDLRLHGLTANATTARFMDELKSLKPIALICEGTRAALGREGRPNHTEHEVRERALQAVKQAQGLVIADFGPRNMERLLIFAEIAREVGRALVVLPKDAYLLEAARLADPDIPTVMQIPGALIYDKPKGSMLTWERALRERNAGRLVSPYEVRHNQDEYILCFSFFDLNELPTIRPQPGSLYLYSSCEAFNEDIQCDFGRLRAWIEHFQMRAVGLPLKELDWNVPPGQEGLHASGHADPKSLITLVQEIAPSILIPVHTEGGIEFFREQLKGSGVAVVAPEYGRPITLDRCGFENRCGLRS